MRGAEKGRASLPERVAQAYYTHGVFCATHPALVIVVAVSLVLLSCIPLVNLPLPSNVPQIFVENNNISVETPKWFVDPPIYIQQVILKSAVSPWKEDLYLTDAIRAPLAEVFHLIETIQNYQHKSGTTLGDICVRVEEPNKPSPLPQYNCLLVSPANFWHQDPNQFYSDINLVSTIYRNQDVLIGKVSLSELLFGMSLREAGMKRYPLRNRQRVIQFAVTFILQKYDKSYMEGLHDHLKSHYPLNSDNLSSTYQPQNILHLYYPGDFDFHEFLPLFFTYLMLFFYMYFSVRKIELVRSKVGMALSAVFTVISSLLMSIGLCLFFGLDPAGSSRGREVFPYLVVVVGLENIIVLTKSVVSTQPHLDSKIRIAQGLSKEGWSITKNLLTEVTILTIGLFTLVPAIQEFCIFAIVGLLCDFFLQMFFFATVLSLDIRGIEAETDRQIPHLRDSSSMKPNSLVRSRSTPRLEYPNPMISNKPHDKIPKRLKLVHFWARTRIVQRAFMLCMVFWIGGFIYSAGIIHHLVPDGQMQHFGSSYILDGFRSPLKLPKDPDFLAQHDVRFNSSDKQGRVLSSAACAKPLSPIKWCHLVMMYNATSGPCRLTLLPPLRLNSVISPRRAIALRNPLEPKEKPFKWHSLANALDSSDVSSSDSEIDYALTARGWESPFLPTSPLEVLLVTALCVISILVISYTALALYHCVCSRNYAQWRSGWTAEAANDTTQVVLQAMPLVLEGQGQCVEAITSDGNTIVCSCLTGDINVWDAFSGESLVHINRKQHFSSGLKGKGNSTESCPSSPLGSPYQRWDIAGSPSSEEPAIDSTFPCLSGIINTRFSQMSPQSPKSPQNFSSQGFDYGPALRHLYFENEVCGNCSHDEINNGESLYTDCPQIWCIDSVENLIAVGTSTGQIEFWEASSGCFKCAFNDGCGVGVTCVKLACGRLVLCRLNGSLEILSITWSSQPLQHSFNKRGELRSGSGHIRAQSAGRLEDTNVDLMCHRISGLRAHQQPITVLLVESGRIVTGSHDHTLKVWSFPDVLLVFTLHGHCGPLTCLFIDSENPMTAGSGSQEGTLCVWDLLTGACVFSLDAHDGPLVALTYSISYVISLGGDERICVWDRFQGHLLNTIQVPQTFCTSICMLTHNLLITSRQGSLVIWNVRSGEPVRLIKLGNCDETTFVRTILPLRDSIACDYGNELRVVRFPLVREKTD